MLFVRVYPREKQEMVFDADDRAFALFRRVGVRTAMRASRNRMGSRSSSEPKGK